MGNKGVSLIEVLVAVAILGIIAVVIPPMITPFVVKNNISIDEIDNLEVSHGEGYANFRASSGEFILLCNVSEDEISIIEDFISNEDSSNLFTYRFRAPLGEKATAVRLSSSDSKVMEVSEGEYSFHCKTDAQVIRKIYYEYIAPNDLDVRVLYGYYGRTIGVNFEEKGKRK